MLVDAMIDLSTPLVVWLLILLAVWISFVKSSTQAAVFMMLILAVTGRFELCLATVFLLLVSLLIPKPNPRHQKRRFRITKAFYLLLLGYGGWTLSHHISKPNVMSFTTPDLNMAIFLIPPAALIAFIVSLLFTRHHVH